MNSPLELTNIHEKISSVSSLKDQNIWDKFICPNQPKRDVEVLMASQMPDKKGISYLEGKQRLLHDLASIELQAMELGVRTLIEFSSDKSIPKEFFKELEQITYEESIHCGLCIETLKEYHGHWGMFPVHLGLWSVSKVEDTILERLLKVHRYLEGSGLDATFSLANKMRCLKDAKPIEELLTRIATDELRHVQFGSKWFEYFCNKEGLSRVSECKRILNANYKLLPRRREKINMSLRKQAGFLEDEVYAFQDYQKTKIQ